MHTTTTNDTLHSTRADQNQGCQEMSATRLVCNLFSFTLTSYEPPISLVKPCAKIVFFWSLQDFCTKAASLNHFKQRADAGHWPFSIITEIPLMEGNFFGIYKSILSLFVRKSVSPTTKKISCIKRNFINKKRGKGVMWNKVWPKYKTSQCCSTTKYKGAFCIFMKTGYFQPSSLFLSINTGPPTTPTFKPHHNNLGLDA